MINWSSIHDLFKSVESTNAYSDFRTRPNYVIKLRQRYLSKVIYDKKLSSYTFYDGSGNFIGAYGAHDAIPCQIYKKVAG